MEAWFVLRTEPGRTKRALISLKEAGLNAYAPMEQRWARHARTKTKKDHPLFPGYVFARLPDDHAYYVATTADGVQRAVCVNGRPITVPALTVAAMVLLEAHGMFDATWTGKPEPKVWKRGQKVRVMSGKLTGAIGEIVRARGKKRMDVMISLFGRTRPVDLPIAHLEAA